VIVVGKIHGFLSINEQVKNLICIFVIRVEFSYLKTKINSNLL